MSNAIDLFLQLVKIDSPSGQEQEMISFIQNWLKQHQLKFKTDSSGNILVTNDGVGKPVLFCVHMDTVEPGKGIKPVINNDVIKSSGNTILGADNKAAVACLLTAVEEYLKREKKPKAFELLFTVKEETTGGLTFFPFNWIKSKKALVFDSAEPIGGIVLRSPFIINFHAEFMGRSAHSSTPEKGKNVLTALIPALNKIKIGKLDGGETTINIGLIKGGTGINTIPEKVNFSGEVRSYKKNLFDKNINLIKEICFSEAEKNGIKLIFKKDGYCLGYVHNEDCLLIERINTLLQSFGFKPKYHCYSGVSDANALNSKGIETINLGDGVQNPHTVNEFIKINNLLKLKEIILTLLSYSI